MDTYPSVGATTKAPDFDSKKVKNCNSQEIFELIEKSFIDAITLVKSNDLRKFPWRKLLFLSEFLAIHISEACKDDRIKITQNDVVR